MSSYFDHFLVIFYLPLISNITIISISLLVILFFLKNTKSLIPSRASFSIILIIDHWRSNLKDNLGDKSGFFVWPVVSLFLFLIITNVMGFILHVIPINSLINVTFGIALTVWIAIIIYSVVNFRENFLAILMPSGAPIVLSPLLMLIEIISNLSRPVALGMRLAANLTAGHILMSILANFGIKILILSSPLISTLPILIMISTTILETAVVFIQAYVFTLLTTIYLKESIIIH